VFLAKEQTLLLSTDAYEHNRKYRRTFVIENPQRNISDEEVLDAFNS
jgi:hypothetical protein